MSTMLEAALSYGSDGIPVFPCNADKKPLTKNGFKEATVDCSQITQWWTKWPDAMIGMPTGPTTGVSVLDLDKKNGKNGFNFVPNWEQLTSTRARTQNGGEHCYFKDDDRVRCTSDQIALGVDTRGRGGYVILPPSAGYAWINGCDFSNLPEWPEHLRPPERGPKKPPERADETIVMELPERIPEGTGLGISDDPNDNLTIEPGLVAAALRTIPNDDLGWDDWNRIGMAAWAATDGSADGLTAFDLFSRKSKKYDAARTTERWQHYRRSPPERIGVGTLIWHANQAEPGWREDLRKNREADEQYGTDDSQQKSEEQPRTNDDDPQQQDQAEQPKTDTGNTRANSERDSPQYRYGALLVRASDIVVRPKDWLWEGHLLRGSLELLTGIPGLGKSQLQCSLIASATTGRPWPNGAVGVAPVHVIMVTAEDAIDQEVVPRLIAAGADLDRVHILKAIKDDHQKRQFLLTDDLDKIERNAEIIERRFGSTVGLITMDPITAYMGGKMDAHKVTEVRSQLGPLKDFAERSNIAVSAVTHPAKNPGKRAIDHFIASQAFIGAARIGHACFEEIHVDEETGDKTPTGRFLFTNPKNNPSVRMPTLAYRITGIVIDRDLVITSSRVEWESEPVEISADDAVAAGISTGKKNAAQAEARQFLRRMLGNVDGTPVLQSDIMREAEEQGFSEKQIRTAARNMQIEKTKYDFGGPSYWKLLL
jgi:hypothetical protein